MPDFSKPAVEAIVANMNDLRKRLGIEIEGTSEQASEETVRENRKTCLDVTRNPGADLVHPLNFILYGAPGTGKTYATAEYALAIIDNKPIEFIRGLYKERKHQHSFYSSPIHF